MKQTLIVFFLLLVAHLSFARTYETSFSGTESPISERGNWTSCGNVGLDWTNVATTSGLAFGTEPGNVGVSTAIVSGSWGANQTVRATVRVLGSDNSEFEDVQLRLRTSCSPHQTTGYEARFSVKSGRGYTQIRRWNGSRGDVTILKEVPVAVKDGDVVKASIVGDVITVYINERQVVSATDSMRRVLCPKAKCSP